MTKVYAVSMWLSCESQDSDILAEFDKRWTDDLKAGWSILVVDAATESDLAVVLNKKIYTDCGKQIGDDGGMTVGKDFNGVDALTASSWYDGTGGLHESYAMVIRSTKSGTFVKKWEFAAAHGKIGRMYVKTYWKEVFVLTSGAVK